MIEELIQLENSILKHLNLSITNITAERECEEYCGYNFWIGNRKIKFRKSKITPKKSGQFVTLWKRNSEGKTEPFCEKDYMDFIIITTESESALGFFLFPKRILVEKGILASDSKKGKRGFRIYSVWDKTDSKQAEKTKSWQMPYFFDSSNSNTECLQKFQHIFASF